MPSGRRDYIIGALFLFEELRALTDETPGLFHSQENQDFVGVVPPCRPSPDQEGNHGGIAPVPTLPWPGGQPRGDCPRADPPLARRATTGGLPLQRMK